MQLSIRAVRLLGSLTWKENGERGRYFRAIVEGKNHEKATFFEEPRGPPLSVLSLRVTQNAFVLPLLLFLEPFPRIEKRAAAALQPRSSLSAAQLPLTFPQFHYLRTITESCVKKKGKANKPFPIFRSSLRSHFKGMAGKPGYRFVG